MKKTVMLGKIEGKRRRGVTEDEISLGSIANSMDMNFNKLQETVEETQVSSTAGTRFTI